MCEGLDLFDRIAPKLLADHFQFFIQTRSAKHCVGFALLHQGHEPKPGGLGVAACGQERRGSRAEGSKILKC